jgi:hypothetical protein
VKRSRNTASNIVYCPESIYAQHDSSLVEERNQWFGLLCIDFLAVTDNLFGIVSSTLLCSAIQQSGHNLISVCFEKHDCVERTTVLGEHTIKFVNLFNCARVTIKEKPDLSIRLSEAIGNDRIGQLVGYIASTGDNRFNLFPELGLVLDIRAEDVTG